MKTLRTLFCALIVCIAITGFQQPEDWYLYETDEFAMKFPEKPELTSQTIPTETEEMRMDIYMHRPKDVSDGNLGYQLLTLEYHDSLIHSSTDYVDEYFRTTIDAAISASEGQLVSEKTISMYG